MKFKPLVPIKYDDIWRGMSVSIPVTIKYEDGLPYDLSDKTIFITMKDHQWDYDYDDRKAVVKNQEIYIEEEDQYNGTFKILLQSEATWQPPGKYFLGIYCQVGGAIGLLALLEFNIIGNVANMSRSSKFLPTSVTSQNIVQITMTEAAPIVIIVPIITNPVNSVIESISAFPQYLKQDFGPTDLPPRHVQIRSFAPKVSINISLNSSNQTRYWFPDYLPYDMGFYNDEIMNSYFEFQGEHMILHIGEFDYNTQIYHQYTTPVGQSTQIVNLNTNTFYLQPPNTTQYGNLNMYGYKNEKVSFYLHCDYFCPTTEQIKGNMIYTVYDFDYINPDGR